MKMLVLSALILLLIAAFCITVTVLDLKAIDEMEDLLSVLEEHEPTEANHALSALEKSFEKYRGLFSVSLPMEDVDTIKNALILLRNAVQIGDDDAYKEGLCALRFALYLVRDAAIPSPETVF